MSDIQIVRAAPEDWELVRELRLRALVDSPDAFGATLEHERAYGRDGWLAWIEGWGGATNALFLALRDATVVGMAVGSITPGRDDAHLYGMWVDPSDRGAGLGRRLVERVLAWARAVGAATVDLSVTDANAGARAFYERMGFADTGDRHPLREGATLEAIVMRRAIEGSVHDRAPFP